MLAGQVFYHLSHVVSASFSFCVDYGSFQVAVTEISRCHMDEA
jgi:hypothetical protein